MSSPQQERQQSTSCAVLTSLPALTPSPTLLSDPGDPDDPAQNPFAPQCRIPLPNPYGPFEYWLEPSFIRRRNERERQRVRNVNDGFERLRSHLPLEDKERDKRLSKVETLRFAIDYILHLQQILRENNAAGRTTANPTPSSTHLTDCGMTTAL